MNAIVSVEIEQIDCKTNQFACCPRDILSNQGKDAPVVPGIAMDIKACAASATCQARNDLSIATFADVYYALEQRSGPSCKWSSQSRRAEGMRLR